MLAHVFFVHTLFKASGRVEELCGLLVHVAKQDRLAESRLVVETRAAVAVPARADLEVEGAVDLVFFCAEDPR